jgi:hypothetical protein
MKACKTLINNSKMVKVEGTEDNTQDVHRQRKDNNLKAEEMINVRKRMA